MVAIAISTLLSCCLATSTLWKMTESPNLKQTTLLKDEISALSKLTKPVPNCPNALVLLGKFNHIYRAKSCHYWAFVRRFNAKALTLIGGQSVPVKHIDYDWVHYPVDKIYFKLTPSFNEAKLIKVLHSLASMARSMHHFLNPPKSPPKKPHYNSMALNAPKTVWLTGRYLMEIMCMMTILLSILCMYNPPNHHYQKPKLNTGNPTTKSHLHD